MQAIWPGKVIDDSAIQETIRTVREALGDPSGDSSVKTLHGEGYRFEAVIERDPSTFAAVPLNNDARMLAQVV